MTAPDPIASLISLLSRLPGIGGRTAARLAFFVLEGDAQYAAALGQALSTIHEEVTRCELCGNYGAASRCAICKDPRRDESLVCVVAKVPDLIALEAAVGRSADGTGYVWHDTKGLNGWRLAPDLIPPLEARLARRRRLC